MVGHGELTAQEVEVKGVGVVEMMKMKSMR
jgi:hypothetical protein